MSYFADYLPFFLTRGRKKSAPPQGASVSRRRKVQTAIAACLILAVLISGFATYAALSEAPPFGNDPNAVIWLLNLDLILLLMLVVLVARRIVSLWSGRKRGLAGSHLHVRLVYIFSILAAAPAIIMTVFSAFFFHYGVQTWFSERVKTAVNESQAVAQAYLQEHTQVIRADTLAMANDLNREAEMLLLNEQAFEKFMRTQSILRNLSEAIVFDAEGRVLARSGLTFSLEFEEIPYYAMSGANDGDVVVVTGGNEDRVRALIKLDRFIDTYLFVGRMIDPQVLSHLAATKAATQDYALLQDRYSGLQVTVTMIFVVVGLLLLVTAIWFGLMLARQLVTPISLLITTADRVRAGDLSARVPDQETLQEFDYLAQSFNRMTKRIQAQQNELIEANRQLDRRRHFTETVLTGVTSGIVALDQEGVITVSNSSACELLGYKKGSLNGENIEQLIPELRPIIAHAHTRPDKITEDEIPFIRGDGGKRSFLVRIAIELIGEEETGTIITFDDITELQSAQRKAAWADVARRIAHEIKNPLTPIQLSAERLNRKYLKDIKDDPETFKNCTETIIRHVEDIGRMVNEFSSFARMPEPNLELCSLGDTVQEALMLHRQAHGDLQIDLNGFDKKPFKTNIDAGQIRQAVTNLLQNAIDSMDAANVKKKSIQVHIGAYGKDEVFVTIGDNGPGFPEGEETSRLTEPYITHKQKGTGLGLAIVKKIMEDHNGRIILGAPDWLKKKRAWKDLGGANAVLVLPLAKTNAKKKS